MRLIDADRFAERLNASPAFMNMGEDGLLMRDIVLNLLSKQPTADVNAEIVNEVLGVINRLKHTKDQYMRETLVELENKYTKEGVN